MANPDPHPTPAENTSELSARLEGKEPDLEVLNKPMDDRLRALNEELIDMGARPKDSVAIPDAREAGNRASDQEATAEDAPVEKPAPKKRAARKSK